MLVVFNKYVNTFTRILNNIACILIGNYEIQHIRKINNNFPGKYYNVLGSLC
jgi:hypothetical protein